MKIRPFGLKRLYLVLLAGFATGIGLPAQGATTYFVDAKVGDDAWSGQQAQVANSDGPWRSLHRVSAASLEPGDAVVLNCGGVWREPLLIRGSGNADAELTIRAQQDCGEAARPEINLALPLNNWLAEGGQVYSTAVSFQVKQVFVDGQYLDQSRYPTSGFLIAENGMPIPDTGMGSTGLVDQSLLKLAGKNFAGAKVHVRTVADKIEDLDLSALFRTQLYFVGSTKYSVRKGVGYYITGKRWMLDNGPGWFWSAGDKRLYVRLPSGVPAAHLMEATQHDYGVVLVNQPNVHISGVRVRYAGLDGVRVERFSRITLDNMEVDGSGRDGIAFAEGSNSTIQNSVIRGSGQDGISLWQSHDVNILKNRVEQSGTIGGPRNSLAAINATNSDNIHIEHNVVVGAGHIGIGYNRNSLVEDNVVRDTCLVLGGCNAIYNLANTDPGILNTVVKGNTVENVEGNRNGNIGSFAFANDLSSDVVGEERGDNKIDRGIQLHNASNNYGAGKKHNHYQIGTFYFPGWKNKQPYAPSPLPWEPIKPFPERKPLLGWYDEGSDKVMRKHIDWMSQYGIDFMVFDWYFGKDRKVYLEHALSAYLRAPNRNKLKFSILWANHDHVPKSREDWKAMVQYWVKNYFPRREYLRVNDMPVVYIFSADYLKIDAEAFGSTSKELLDSAQTIARQAGLPGIHFVAGTPANVPMITGYAKKSGYASFSGYFYHQGPYATRFSHSYDELDKGYREHWKRFADVGSLPLVIPPMTAGWDRRPWGGSKDPLHDNSRSTPEQFRKHLEAAKSFMDANPVLTQRMGVICCWNEFGEGSYIEPTEKTGFKYLEQIRKVFGSEPSREH